MDADENPDRRTRAGQEVDDLVRTLRDYGVLTRGALRERSGAGHWPDGTFESVLRHGVAEGRIKQLDDLFEVGDDVPELSDAEFDPT